MLLRSLRAAALLLGVGITVVAANAWAQPEPAKKPAVSPPQVIEHVDANYPSGRLSEQTAANVVVFVTVEKDGSVGDATIAESGGEDFDEAALTAVKRWRFTPALRDGVPVRARIRVPFHFAAEPHPSPPPAPAAAAPPGTVPGAVKAPEPPNEVPEGTALPHAVNEPGKPIEIHVQGRPNPPRRSTSDFRLDAEVLDAAPHANAADMLNTAPGFLVVHPEGLASAQRVVLRGFDADHGQDVEFSVGAVPMNQISHLHGQGYADLNLLIPETVRSVRVLEGIYDPSQGDFAVAGSVDFDLAVQQRGVTLKTSYGSFNSVRFLALWAPEDQAEETFAAGLFQQTDGFGQNRQGVSGAVIGQYKVELPGDASALLHFASYGARSGLAGAVRRDDVDAGRIGFYDVYDDPNAKKQAASTSRSQVALTFDRAAADGSKFDVAVWGAYETYRARLDFTGYLLNPTLGDLTDQGNQDAGMGGRLVYRTRRFEPLSWLSGDLGLGATGRVHGIEQSQSQITEPENATWQDDTKANLRVVELGMYGDLGLNFTRYVHLRGGLRADFVSFDVDDKLHIDPAATTTASPFGIPGSRRDAAGIALGPRGTFEVDPLAWLRLMASAGIGHRTPEALQLQDGAPVPFTTVDSYEVGFRMSDKSIVSLTGAAFVTKLSQDTSFEALTGTFENIGPTTRTGFVGYFQAAPIENFTSALSATFVDARLDQPVPGATKVPFVPPVLVRADVGYKRAVTSLWNKPLEVHAGYGTTFLSPRPLTDTLDAPAAFIVDVSAGVKRSFLDVSVDIFNLFDQKYAEQEYFYASRWHPNQPAANVPVEHITPGAPFTIFLTTTVSL